MIRIGYFILLLGLVYACGTEPTGRTNERGPADLPLDSLQQAAQQLLENGQPDLAIELLRGQEDNPELVLLLARAFYDYEENELALSTTEEAIAKFRELGQEEEVLQTLLFKGEIALYLEDHQLADSTFASIISGASKARHWPYLLQAHLQRSATIRPGQRDLESLHRALEIADSLQDQEKLVEITQLLASEYKASGNLVKAEIYYLKLLEHKAGLVEEGMLVSDIRSLGRLYQEAGLLERAQQQFIEALRIVEEGKDTLRLAELSTEISELFIQSRIWTGVEKYASKAIDLTTDGRLNAQLLLAQNLNYLGIAKENQQELDAAVSYYRRSLDLFQQLGDYLNSAKLHVQLAKLEKDDARLEKALRYYYQALNQKQRNQEQLGVMQVKMEIANLLLQEGKTDEALQFLQECEDLGKQTNAKDELRKVYQSIAQIYALQRDYQNALAYQQASSLLRDSVLDQKIAESTNKLAIEYNFEKQELETKSQKLARELAENEVKELRLQNITIILFGLSVVIILIAYILRRRQLHRQKILILEKEKEAQRLRSIIIGEENERKRVARELHDGIGALLSTVKMQFDSLGNLLPNLRQQERFNQAESLLDNACEEVRRISHNMMPGVLEHYGLEFALEELCNSIQQSSGLDIAFMPYGLDQFSDQALSLSVYRVVQELLKNVVQHAAAQEVIVQATFEDDNLNLVVEDDGRGFDPKKIKLKKGIGLDNVQSRVTFLGGELEIESKPGQGSTFMANIPYITNTKTNS